ncbi:hypothetical protein [Streptomyces sp. NPDC055036]
MTSSEAATAAVGRNLQKDHPDHPHEPVGGCLPLDSLERFTDAAQAWLSDKSKLSTRTIEGADYRELYGRFCEMGEKLPNYGDQEPERDEGRYVVAYNATDDVPDPSLHRGWEILNLLKERQEDGPVSVADLGSLDQEELRCLVLLGKQDGVLTSASGHKVSISTVRKLENDGLVILTTLAKRKWVAELTKSGKGVSGLLKGWSPGKSGESTQRVSLELLKQHPDYPLEEVWERIPVTSLEDFRESVQQWLGDRSDLPGKVIREADYEELFADFRGRSEPEQPPQAAPQRSRKVRVVPVDVQAVPELVPEAASVKPANIVYVTLPDGTEKALSVPEDEFGTAVAHKRTGEVVGFLKVGKGFWTVDVIREILKGRK